jgi:low affinity Fe/Cu permease
MVAVTARRRRKDGGPMSPRRGGFGLMCENISSRAVSWTGSTSALLAAVGLIVVWLLTGPAFRYSDTWQLVMNTATSVITFLMVFLIQRSQNKESLAVQLKLNELVAAVQGASNRLIDVESLSEKELDILHHHYRRLVDMSKKDEDLGKSHSVDEAQQRHTFKERARRKAGQTTA